MADRLHKPNHQLAASILIGACVLTAADWLSRVVIYPYQVPVGLCIDRPQGSRPWQGSEQDCRDSR
jgi:ABC-type Fe3+-siderophore transport system permease subunit